MKRLIVYLLLFSFTVSALAIDVEGTQVMYTGGTITTLKEGAMGRLDTSSETALIFESAGTKVVIPYAKIQSFGYSRELARHLGVVPTIAVVLVKHRQRRHFFKISFRDEHDVPQVAVLEVSKEAPRALRAILQARAPELCGKKTNCGFYE